MKKQTLYSKIEFQCTIIFFLTSILIVYKYLELVGHLVRGGIIPSLTNNSEFVFLYFLTLINISTVPYFVSEFPNKKLFLIRFFFSLMKWYLIILSIFIFLSFFIIESLYVDNLSINFILYILYFGVHPCLVWVVVSNTKVTTNE